jgi:hypothetical protein
MVTHQGIKLVKQPFHALLVLPPTLVELVEFIH